MGAAAGLDPHDAVERQGFGAGQDLGILLGVDVVGDGRDLVPVAQAPAELLHQCCLARAHRAADPDTQGAVS